MINHHHYPDPLNSKHPSTTPSTHINIHTTVLQTNIKEIVIKKKETLHSKRIKKFYTTVSYFPFIFCGHNMHNL